MALRSSDLEGLTRLEAGVSAAAEEIAALRADNRRLGSRLKRLRRELAEKPTAEVVSRDARDEFRGSLEKLISTLEKILER